MTAAPKEKTNHQGGSKDILEVLAEFIADSKRQEEKALGDIASIVDGLSTSEKSSAITAFQTFDRTHQEMVEISEILLRLASRNRADGANVDELSRAVDLLSDVRLEKLKSSLSSALGLDKKKKSSASDGDEDVTLF